MGRGSWAAQGLLRETCIPGHSLPDTYASSDTLRRHPILTVTILMCLSHLSGVGQTFPALHTQTEMDTHTHVPETGYLSHRCT